MSAPKMFQCYPALTTTIFLTPVWDETIGPGLLSPRHQLLQGRIPAAMVQWTPGMQGTTDVCSLCKVRLQEGGAQSLPAVTAIQANTLSLAKEGSTL